MSYLVQKGKLNGNYKDVMKPTTEKSSAWARYFSITLECGEKKRIQELVTIGDAKPVTLKMDRRYWTQGYGER